MLAGVYGKVLFHSPIASLKFLSGPVGSLKLETLDQTARK
jgi:hypothetical protein